MSFHKLTTELFKLIEQNNGADARRGGKRASERTQETRKLVLYAAFKQLHHGKYRLPTVTAFREKHAKYLFQLWESQGLAASTMQTRASVLRFFCRWIGKPGMIRDLDQYLIDPKAGKRTYIAKNDKSWTAKEIDPEHAIAKLAEDDPITAMQLQMCLVFGLRKKEAIMLKPHLADKGHYLAVSEGTKGGRDRTVQIDTEKKRQTLEKAKSMAKFPHGRVSHASHSLVQEMRRFSYILNSRGFNKAELGVTAHGLRHQYLNDRYEQIAGHPSPVRGGIPTDKAKDDLARLITTEEAGHSRKSITPAYYGSSHQKGHQPAASQETEATKPEPGAPAI